MEQTYYDPQEGIRFLKKYGHALQELSLNNKQKEQINMMAPLYRMWNKKLNLLSRTDIDHLYFKHTLHALSIAILFKKKLPRHVLDIGTGGGFPGIPLAIACPEVHFTLVDARAKKINAVKQIIDALELTNAQVIHSRVEEMNGLYDLGLARSVAPLSKLCQWSRGKVRFSKSAPLQGLLVFKGGDLTLELSNVKKSYKVYDLYPLLPWPFFQEKKLVHLYH